MGHLFQKPIPVGWSRFSSPKPEKTRSDRYTKISFKKIPESGESFQIPAIFSRFRHKFPDSGVKFPYSGVKFLDSGKKLSYFGDLSSRSSDISSKSSEISPDLARSYQIRLDLRRIWRFFAWNQLFWLDFSPWTVPTEPTVFSAQNWLRRSDSLAGRRRVRIFSTRFYRVGLGLGTNPTRTDPWTPLSRLE